MMITGPEIAIAIMALAVTVMLSIDAATAFIRWRKLRRERNAR
jgi:hypothetical protein